MLLFIIIIMTADTDVVMLASSQAALDRLKSALNSAKNQGDTMKLEELQASIDQCMKLKFTPPELQEAGKVSSEMKVPLLPYLPIR